MTAKCQGFPQVRQRPTRSIVSRASAGRHERHTGCPCLCGATARCPVGDEWQPFAEPAQPTPHPKEYFVLPVLPDDCFRRGPYPARACLSLKKLLKMVTARWPKSGTPRAPESLWLSRKGGALTSSAIGQMMGELVKTAGKLVPQETSVHSLRHTFARSYLSIYPGDVVGLAKLLGHSSLNTTRLYSRPGVSRLAARVERLPLNAYSGSG